MKDFLTDIQFEFQRHKDLADRAMETLDDNQFMYRPGGAVNPIALIVKHLAGNLVSRWTDFLTTDGEKPSRDRDGEFLLTESDSSADLLEAWENGWAVLFATLGGLQDADLTKSVTIRGESQTVPQSLLRGITHVAYHVGQILYVARMLQPDSKWLTIAPGQSKSRKGDYRKT